VRPQPRPEDLVPATALLEAKPEEDESDSPDRSAELLAAAAAAAEALGGSVPGLATATSEAVARSPRPDARPRNMAVIVERARAQQARAAAATQASAPRSQPGAAVAPSGPTGNRVAAAATIDNAINLRRINLIGVYGQIDDRRALVRLANGRFVRVGVGDRLDGGRVSAIGDGFLQYVRGGRNVQLNVPG